MEEEGIFSELLLLLFAAIVEEVDVIIKEPREGEGSVSPKETALDE